MRAFRFRLQRVMEFRHTRLAEEERKLKLLQMELNVVAEQIEDVRRAPAVGKRPDLTGGPQR